MIDSTSNVRAIRTLIPCETNTIIAHRLSTTKRARRILMLAQR